MLQFKMTADQKSKKTDTIGQILTKLNKVYIFF